MILCTIVGCSSKGTENINTKKGFDTNDLGKQMTLLQDQVKEFYTDIEYSYDKDDWTVTEYEDGGNITVWTKNASLNGEEIENITYIYTPQDNNKYISNYLRIGSEVLIDDKSIE